jgi:hypothetical protein
MRFMVIVKASHESESGTLPTRDMLASMQNFNAQLASDGAMLAAEGLQPSSKGARIRFSEGTPLVVQGPFASVRELIAGFWIVQADSLQEAIALMKPAPMEAGAEIEIRPIVEAADFGQSMTAEMRAAGERMAAHMAANTQG